jgi:FkbM family methyltransferase
VDKCRCWHALSVCMWMNEYSDFWYKYIHGDKETFHLAWRATNVPYSMPKFGIQALAGTMCQHDFDGRRLFQHRNMLKWSLFDNSTSAGFINEDLCIGFLRDEAFRRAISGLCSHNSLTEPSDPSNRDSQAVYTRVGFETRTIVLERTGLITGAGERERYWRIEDDGERRSMRVFGEDCVETAVLTESSKNVWNGKWSVFERMPVEILVQSNELAVRVRDFSQNGEQFFLLNWFKERSSGYFVDIGASDGITDSNSRALFLNGWRGLLVEPVPEEFWNLEDNYRNCSGIELVNAAIGQADGYSSMWIARSWLAEPYAHADNRHTMLKHTAEQYAKDSRPAQYYDLRRVRSLSVKTLVDKLSRPIDFLTVDAEGMDASIVQWLLELKVMPELVMCGIDDGSKATRPLMSAGYREVYRNRVNAAWTVAKDHM